MIYRLAHRMPFYYGWVILFAAGSSMVARNATGSLTLAVFIYPISQELGWSRTLIAGAASLGGLVSSVASPAAGWASDRYGVRLLLTLSVLVLGLSTFSLGWATVPLAFYLAYGTGRVMFSSSVQIGASVVVSRWFIKQRGRATGLLFVSHSIGMVLFPLTAGFAISSWGWQQAWIFLGVLVWAGALAPVSLLIRQSPEAVGLRPDGEPPDSVEEYGKSRARPEEPGWTLRQASRTPCLWLLALATGSLFLLQSGTNIHQGAYFIDQGLGIAISTVSISLNAVFTGVGSIAWGWLVERVPVQYTYSAVALLMTAALALFTIADTPVEALVAASMFGVSVGGILVVPVVAYADYYGRRSLAAIRGVTEPFVSLGQAIGAVFSGLIFDSTGSYHYAFASLAVLGFATMNVLLVAKPPRPTSVQAQCP